MNRRARIDTLVAYDFGPMIDGIRPDLHRLLQLMGDAVVSVETVTEAHPNTAEPQDVHRIRFDTAELRDTSAHGMGYRCGFVPHIQPGTRPQANRPDHPS